MDKKFQIIFESSEIQKAYNALLAHVCPKCPERHAFQNFALLRDHMRREHELYYCDLCIDNLKVSAVSNSKCGFVHTGDKNKWVKQYYFIK